MTFQIEAVTTAALSLALQAAARRQEAIAANIANAGSVGAVPSDVAFDDQLEQARLELRATGSATPASLAEARPELQPLLDAQGQPAEIRLDTETARLAGNALHYQALVQGLSRHLGLLALAASEGRR